MIAIPAVPKPQQQAKDNFSRPVQAPIKAIPSPPKPPQPKVTIMPEIFLPSVPEKKKTVQQHAKSQSTPPPVESPFKAAPDFTDEDLATAFAPIVQTAIRDVVFTNEKPNVDAMLEPMLRATVRRALAEYSPSNRPFQPPGFMDRSVWRLQALFSSQTYEDVLFEKTNRFQIEEVYLLDASTLALVSFASCDPARHSTAKRVNASAKRIALQIRNENGQIRRSLEKADGRNVIAESGEFTILVAIVRGRPNELILADLEFSLKRIEEHFRDRFKVAGSALMHALQPFLEDCLLIQAPASAA
ncbi:MAG: hypothetical protein ACSHX7_04315 [Luteolibacter sp.]